MASKKQKRLFMEALNAVTEGVIYTMLSVSDLPSAEHSLRANGAVKRFRESVRRRGDESAR